MANIVKLVGAAEDSKEILDIETRIKSLEEKLSRLGAKRSDPAYTIDSLRVGGANSTERATGTYVSTINASSAVGGRYAVDGISKIIFKYSPLN